MKKKVLAAFLLVGALMAAPVGGGFFSVIATASSNNSGSNITASSNNSGSGTVGGSVSGVIDYWAIAEDAMINTITGAESGAVVELEGVTTLSNTIMKELLRKGDVTLVLKYTYQDIDYVVTIPAGAALDNDIPWYGPLYLAAQFGNGTNSKNEASVYIVQPGDTMNKIASQNNMTLNELVAKNPQIKNVNMILVGQEINLK